MNWLCIFVLAENSFTKSNDVKYVYKKTNKQTNKQEGRKVHRHTQTYRHTDMHPAIQMLAEKHRNQEQHNMHTQTYI